MRKLSVLLIIFLAACSNEDLGEDFIGCWQLVDSNCVAENEEPDFSNISLKISIDENPSFLLFEYCWDAGTKTQKVGELLNSTEVELEQNVEIKTIAYLTSLTELEIVTTDADTLDCILNYIKQ